MTRCMVALPLCSPFFGEEYRFRVPREFQRLTFYLCEPGLRCDSKIGKVAISKGELRSAPSRDEQWYSIRPIDADSEVQVRGVWRIGCVCVCERERRVEDWVCVRDRERERERERGGGKERYLEGT